MNSRGHFQIRVPLLEMYSKEGLLSGFIHANQAIIRMEFQNSNQSMGIIIDGVQDNKLVGKLNLLPDCELNGRIEAIRVIK